MVDRRYKVLHIFSGYGGGISSLVINLIKNKTSAFDFDVMAFSFQNGAEFLDVLHSLGTQSFEMPRPKLDGFPAFFRFVKNVLTKNKYDAIHCHIVGYSALPFYYLGLLSGCKVFVLHAHTTRYDSRIDRINFVYKLDKKINYSIAKCYMTCSDLAAEYIFGQKYINKKETYLIANGIEKNKYLEKLTTNHIEGFCKAFNIPDNTKVLLHVGRFSYPKNHSFLLKVIKELIKLRQDFVLVMVGTGELEDKVKFDVEQLNLSNSIRFAGRRQDIPLLMKFADIVLLPSLNEGLPTVAIESQAAGTPILMSDKITRQADMKIGLAEYLPIDNPFIWAKRIDQALAENRNSLQNPINRIEEQGFTADIAGKNYCDILRKMIMIHEA